MRLLSSSPLSCLSALLVLLLSLSFFPSPVSCAGDVRYIIMIDAGSTGSRIHIHSYTWPTQADGSLTALPVIEPSVNVKIRGGLSSFARAPQNASLQVADLLKTAREKVPSEQWAATPIHLQATAGLRSVTPQQAAAILKVVRQSLTDSEFLFEDDWALIISGEQEGINGWLATNYLLGAFEPNAAAEAHGVVEMGGASMQITFAPQSTAGLSAASKARLSHLFVAGKEYYLYTHSYLAYGLQEAQKLYQAAVMEEIEDKGNPCYPAGFRHSSTGNFDQCFALMSKVVNKEKECDFEPCAFNGVWQPAIVAEPFLAIENFFYTSKFFSHEEGVVQRGQVVATGNLLVKTLKERGMEFCDDPWEQIVGDHADAIKAGAESQSTLSYYCFAAAYEAAVLEKGFGFGERSNIRPARTIDLKAIDWEMGATLIELMKQQGLDIQQNPHVTAWNAGFWGRSCTSWTCRAGVLLVVGLTLTAGLLLWRTLRKDPMQRGYSMLHHGDRGGGWCGMWGKA